VKRVLISGGTGFVGTRLCEVLTLTKGWTPRVFGHSTASATRIARFPAEFVFGDLRDKHSVTRAIEGCDAVVHLARGESAVMTRGLENLLQATLKQRCARFVHLSSVAVYGNHPPLESVSEEAPPKPGDMAYGIEKLKQEHRIRRYGRRHGLPFVILRPPNIYGPFAPFTMDVIAKIRAGQMAIVNGGQNPCNLVYVDNLIEAILLSLWKPDGIGETFFVTDFEMFSWERCMNDYAALLGTTLPRVSPNDLVSRPRERLIWDSLTLLPSVLFSSDLRTQLRKLPLIKALETALYEQFQCLSVETQQRLRVAISGPVTFQKTETLEKKFRANDPLIAAQGRMVAHSSEKAKRLLGYSAPVPYRQGMALTESWLRYAQLL
jgi:nucleoside-diphosphate-sugar epimerase